MSHDRYALVWDRGRESCHLELNSTFRIEMAEPGEVEPLHEISLWKCANKETSSCVCVCENYLSLSRTHRVTLINKHNGSLHWGVGSSGPSSRVSKVSFVVRLRQQFIDQPSRRKTSHHGKLQWHVCVCVCVLWLLLKVHFLSLLSLALGRCQDINLSLSFIVRFDIK